MPRRYAVAGTTSSPTLERIVREVAEEFEKDDFEAVEHVDDADFVLKMFEAETPKAFRRKSRGV